MTAKRKTTKKPRNLNSKVGLGFALIILGAILVFGRPEISLPSQSFATEPVIIQGFQASGQESENIPTNIVIPALSIDLEVKKSKIIGGFWEVFPDTAGWGEGSGLPGENGNQVIFAHAREGLFLPLKKVSLGMRIYVMNESEVSLSTLPPNVASAFQDNGQENIRTSSWYTYEVVEIKEVYPNQTEVIEPTDDETLTLYTCSGFADSKRLIVVAKRV